MYSNTDDTFLIFKNVGGYIKLQLYGDDVTVKSITLSGNNGEKIAGQANITAAYDKAPMVSMADDATTSITLDCGEKGVKIGATPKRATAFWVVVPPTSFEKGFTIKVKDVDGKVYTQTTDKQLTIERNMVKPMAAVEAIPQNVEIPYLNFTADAEQTLTMSKAVETLEYSVDGGEWKTLGTTTVAFGGEKGDLRLRGKSLTGTATSPTSNNYSTIAFGDATIEVACTGNIRTLVDYENYDTVDTGNVRFCSLFRGCISLTQAPVLPATTLASCCYRQMFVGCTNLTDAPELPAATLVGSCYNRMFNGCSNLRSIVMMATDISAMLCLTDWLGGVASSGTFTKAKEMTSLPIGTSGIPSGWTVIDDSYSIGVYPETLEFSGIGQKNSIGLSVSPASTITITSDADWCTPVEYDAYPFSTPSEGFKLVVRVDDNLGERRMATLTIRAGSSIAYCYIIQRAIKEDKNAIGGTVGDEVDLGLSVLWSSHNVEAFSQTEAGAYLAWGELEEKEKYNTDTYIYYNNNYATYVDIGEGISGRKYDAATVFWGNGWRMPTWAEFLELINNCTWEWTQVDQINGWRVIGPNGNSIFLPAKGYKSSDSITNLNTVVALWSDCLLSYNPSHAIGIHAPSYHKNQFNCNRTNGLPIRPVKYRICEEID